MRKACLLLILIGITNYLFAQKNGTIKGVAYDSLSRQNIGSVTVSVMDKKDSSLITFTMTDHLGAFELKGIPNGNYRLLLTHVSYHNNAKLFSITDSTKLVDFGNIYLHDVSKVLSEVVVTSEAPPVTLIGDTVQYNAGSFKTVPNASVEQLLKKLPGVKVDKDGTVTAQGEKVNRVLVDGKEFFGNDPKVATRNLPADAVDKVQVYDRQSEQAQLTGFEDGNYEKTINLKLKKDKKKGVFGKVMAGGGNKDRYEGKFNVNSFKGARQLSAIGMGNNTNAEGFSFMDILNFTGALNQMKQGGNISVNLSQDEAASLGMNNNSNRGINTSWAGGVNYNNIVGTKLDLQSNYFFNRYNPNTKTHVYRQNIFPGSSNFYDENSNTDNLNNGHRLNLNLLYQLDSLHSIRVTPSFSYQRTRNRSAKNYFTKNEQGAFINEGFSNNESESEGYNFKNDIMFRKKFSRKGRTFSASLTTTLNESKGDGNLESIINYYQAGNIYDRDTLNQLNENQADLRGYNARLVYTEPLWKRSLLEFSVSRSNTRNLSEKLTYDYNKSSGKYDLVNSKLSNDFQNTYAYNTGGVRMRKQGKKYSYSVGLNWQQAELEGKIINGIKDSVISKSFNNLLPTATFRYNFSRFRNFSLQYNASTNQPSMSQLQPVPDLSNPLYIRDGNPDLKQEYSQTVRANLALISPFKNKNFFLFLNLQTISNRIVNYDTVNLFTGVRRTKPVNVNGVYMVNANIDYSIPVRPLKASVQFGSNITYNNGKQFINGQANNIKTLTFRPEVRMDFNPNDKLSFNIGTSLGINRSKYSLESSLNNKYLTQEYSVSGDLQLPKSFYLSSDFVYTINNQLAAGFNTNVPIWNASLSKQFLHFNRGEIKLSVADLLNRNISITRNTNQNYIEDKEVNTLRRYFLLSFTYSLSKTGATASPGGNMRMIMR